MTQRLGQDYQLFVDDGAGTFNPVAGQTGLTRDGSTNLINTSSKTTGKYDTQAPGRAALTLTVNGKLDLPDANGFERVSAIEAVYPQQSADFQLREAPFAVGDVVFQAPMFVSNLNTDFPDQDNATYSFQLTLDGPPTVDDLTP